MKEYTILKDIALTTVLLLIICMALSCSDNNNPNESKTSIIDNNIVNAPSQIEIDGQEFSLSSYLWRDYMPISPIDGKELAAVVYIATSDSSQFPLDLKADKMWVLNKDEIWEAQLTNGTQPDGNFKIKKSANGGPKWDVGSEVIVVVQLVDKNNQIYYIKEDGSLIRRTD